MLQKLYLDLDTGLEDKHYKDVQRKFNLGDAQITMVSLRPLWVVVVVVVVVGVVIVVVVVTVVVIGDDGDNVTVVVVCDIDFLGVDGVGGAVCWYKQETKAPGEGQPNTKTRLPTSRGVQGVLRFVRFIVQFKPKPVVSGGTNAAGNRTRLDNDESFTVVADSKKRGAGLWLWITEWYSSPRVERRNDRPSVTGPVGTIFLRRFEDTWSLV